MKKKILNGLKAIGRGLLAVGKSTWTGIATTLIIFSEKQMASFLIKRGWTCEKENK